MSQSLSAKINWIFQGTRANNWRFRSILEDKKCIKNRQQELKMEVRWQKTGQFFVLILSCVSWERKGRVQQSCKLNKTNLNIDFLSRILIYWLLCD